MKLWLDDVRPAPDGWHWARTNAEAKAALLRGNVDECSLDHDLGLHELTDEQINDWDHVISVSYALQATGTETGLDLVEWMIQHDLVPDEVTIHSWNPDGAHRMAMRLVDDGHEVLLAPFNPRKEE